MPAFQPIVLSLLLISALFASPVVAFERPAYKQKSDQQALCAPTKHAELAVLAKVVDGDTLRLRGGKKLRPLLKNGRCIEARGWVTHRSLSAHQRKRGFHAYRINVNHPSMVAASTLCGLLR